MKNYSSKGLTGRVKKTPERYLPVSKNDNLTAQRVKDKQTDRCSTWKPQCLSGRLQFTFADQVLAKTWSNRISHTPPPGGGLVQLLRTMSGRNP